MIFDMLITVTQHEKNEWARFAQAAYSSGRNEIGHRYSVAASIPNGARMETATYDSLQKGWRAIKREEPRQACVSVS